MVLIKNAACKISVKSDSSFLKLSGSCPYSKS